MLKLHNELTYNKGKNFLYYLLGVRNFKDDFETLKDINLQLITPDKTETILQFPEDETIRIQTVASMRSLIKNTDAPFSLFRCDYDYNMLDSENKSAYESNYNTILSLVQEYCRKHKTVAFIGNHFNQYIENTKDYLCRHTHIIYEESIEETLSEYMLRNLM